MKFTKSILLAIIVCLLTSFSVTYYSTTWSGTANNQAVTFTAMQDAFTNNILTQKIAMTSSLRLMTKSAVSTYAVVDSSYGPFAAKSSGQLVVKSDIVAVNNITINFNNYGHSQSSTLSGLKFYYKINSGSWILHINTFTANFLNYDLWSSTITAPSGSTIYFAIRNSSDVDVNFGVGQNSGVYNTYCGQRIPYSATASGTMTTYFNVAASGATPTTC